MRRLLGPDNKPQTAEERQAYLERMRVYEAQRRQGEIDRAGCKTCEDAGFLPPDVAFGHPDFGKKLIPCPDCRDWTWEQRERAKRASRLGNPRQTFDNFNKIPGTEKAFDTIKVLAEGTADYLWVIVYGQHGSAKTHLLNATVNLTVERGIQAEYWDVRELGDELHRKQRTDGLEDFLDHLYELPFLALDELGAERHTPFLAEKIEQIINKRYETLRPLVAGTNLSWEQLAPPIASRFSDSEIARRCLLKTEDYRPLKGKLR